jgi:WD40 repeat protein
VARVGYAADGKTLCTYGEDGSLRVWEAASGSELRQFDLPEETRFLALATDGRTLALAGKNGTLILHDLATGKERHRIVEPTGGTVAAAFSPDGRTLAVLRRTDPGLSIRLSDVATARELRRLAVPAQDVGDTSAAADGVVTGMAFSADGATLAAPVSPSTLGLWNVSSGRSLPAVRAPGGRAIHDAVFAPYKASVQIH